MGRNILSAQFHSGFGLKAYLSGLQLRPPNARAAAKAVVYSIAAVTIFVVALDAVIFRSALPSWYETYFTSSLVPRTLVMCVSAAIEEVEYRLLGMTALVILFTAWRGKLSPTTLLVAILLPQLAGVWPVFADHPLYAALRFWAVGGVWGWLYWRHGWYAALIGHSATHLVLDPLLKFALLNT